MPSATLLTGMKFSRRQFGTGILTTATGTSLFHGSRLPAAPRPKLMVLLIAEQFRPDYLDELWGAFSPGGFRRLIEAGSYFPDCRFESGSFTSSGMATLLTAAWPSFHGIVAERWFNSGSGQPEAAAAGHLKVGTLLDSVLGREHNRVFLIASGGATSLLRGITGAATFLSVDGQWNVTRGDAPGWLRSFQESNARAKWQGSSWYPAGTSARAGTVPLRVLDGSDFPALFEASPFALANQFGVAREIVLQERAGALDGVDVIALAIGSLGSLGLETGAESPLMRDLVLHLDRQIGSLADLLDDRVGRGNYTIAFTATHGLDSRTSQTASVDGAEIANAAQKRLSDTFDTGPIRRNYVQAWLYPFLYLNRKSLREANGDLADARRIAAQAGLDTGKLAGYYTADGDCSYSGPWRERFANTCFNGRSGDVMFSYPPHFLESAAAVTGGSLYNYDTRVPLLFYGPAFRAQTFEDAVSAVDVSPTLARVLGVGTPASGTGRVLGEAIAPPPRTGR